MNGDMYTGASDLSYTSPCHGTFANNSPCARFTTNNQALILAELETHQGVMSHCKNMWMFRLVSLPSEVSQYDFFFIYTLDPAKGITSNENGSNTGVYAILLESRSKSVQDSWSMHVGELNEVRGRMRDLMQGVNGKGFTGFNSPCLGGSFGWFTFIIKEDHSVFCCVISSRDFTYYLYTTLVWDVTIIFVRHYTVGLLGLKIRYCYSISSSMRRVINLTQDTRSSSR